MTDREIMTRAFGNTTAGCDTTATEMQNYGGDRELYASVPSHVFVQESGLGEGREV